MRCCEDVLSDIPSEEPKVLMAQLESGPTSSETEITAWKPGLREWVVFSAVTLETLLITTEGTILVAILPDISDSLKGDSVYSYWCGTIYFLLAGISQPAFIALSDMISRRWYLYTTLSIFTLGSLICCLSHRFPQMLAGRAIQGLGGGGTIVGNFVVVIETFPLRERPKYNGLILLLGAVGSIIGPLVGGFFVDHSTWRWAFYMNFPIVGFIMIILVFARFPQVELHTMRRMELLRDMDWVGALMFLATMTAFLIGLSWGGVQFPWNSPMTYLPIVLGGLGLVATVAWELRQQTATFLHIDIFLHNRSMIAYAGVFVQAILLFCELYYIPLFFEAVHLLSPSHAALRLIPLTAGILPSTAIVGWLITKTGHIWWAIILGWATMAASTGCLILFGPETNTAQWISILGAVGVGHGITLSASNTAVVQLADSRKRTNAAAMYSFVRTLGMCIGIPLGGSVFSNRLKLHASQLGLPSDLARNAEGAVSLLRQSDAESAAMHRTFALVYSSTFQDLSKVLVGIASLGLLLGLFTPRVRLEPDV